MDSVITYMIFFLIILIGTTITGLLVTIIYLTYIKQKNKNKKYFVLFKLTFRNKRKFFFISFTSFFIFIVFLFLYIAYNKTNNLGEVRLQSKSLNYSTLPQSESLESSQRPVSVQPEGSLRPSGSAPLQGSAPPKGSARRYGSAPLQGSAPPKGSARRYGSALLQGTAPPQYKSFDELVCGKIGYNLPDTMKVGNQYRGIVTISKALNDSILFMNLDPDNFTSEEIKVSSKIEVSLIDPSNNKNFDIVALNTKEQLVDITSNTIWKWEITPLKSGRNKIILRATVKVITDLGETPKDIPVFEKIITVQTSPILTFEQFLGNNWQWLGGTIIIPILIWRFQILKKKKKINRT